MLFGSQRNSDHIREQAFVITLFAHFAHNRETHSLIAGEVNQRLAYDKQPGFTGPFFACGNSVFYVYQFAKPSFLFSFQNSNISSILIRAVCNSLSSVFANKFI